MTMKTIIWHLTNLRKNGKFNLINGLWRVKVAVFFAKKQQVNILWTQFKNSQPRDHRLWSIAYGSWDIDESWIICILGTDPLALGSDWDVWDGEVWSRGATIKIFSDEKQYNEYQKTLQKWFETKNTCTCKNLVIQKLP